MSVSGFQDFWLAGSRFMFQRQADAFAAAYPLIDLGVIEPASPKIAPTKVQLKDSDGGLNHLVEEALTEIQESYSIVCSNLNIENRSLLFLSTTPAAFTQAATPQTDVPHDNAIVGKLVKLHTAAGVPIFSLTSIEAVKIGATTLVLGTDYEIVSLDRGVIRLLATASTGVLDAVVTLLVSFTPVALSGKRLLNPQSAGGTIKGTGYIFHGRENNARQTVRYATVSISPSAASFENKAYSNFTLDVAVLSDITSTTAPAGVMLDFKGSATSAS